MNAFVTQSKRLDDIFGFDFILLYFYFDFWLNSNIIAEVIDFYASFTIIGFEKSKLKCFLFK